MIFGLTVESILHGGSAECVTSLFSSSAYIVPVGSAHHESTVTHRGKIGCVSIAGDTLEEVAAPPTVVSRPSISIQLVRLAEIVPRSE